MRIQVVVFGSLAEAIDKREFALEGISDTDQLKAVLCEEHPVLSSKNYRIAVNQELVKGNRTLVDRDEVALLPPFSGG